MRSLDGSVRHATLLAAFIIAESLATAAEGLKTAELEWLRKTAIPLRSCEAGQDFADLDRLQTMIGDSRIVSLGECTHGTREVFQMKHRLLEYLATKRGFTIFSIEANMPEAYRLNDYVLEGKGDPAKLIAGMYFWTWNTEEVLAMVQWIRQFNQSGKGRLEFTGFDMQTPDVAMDNVLRFVKAHQPERLDPVTQAYNRARKARLQKMEGGGSEGFGVATGTFPVEAAKGKKIRYSGWIKTTGVTNGFAGLWWRADGEAGVLAFDNMASRNIKGDTDWKEYDVTLDIPEKTVNINFGVLLTGQGRAGFDDLKVELAGVAFNPSNQFDFTFEGGVIKGFFTPPTGYAVVIDNETAHTGKRSLRMESSPPKVSREKDPALKPMAVAKECGDILNELEVARDRLAAATSPAETDWAIQNARVVHQCLRLDAQQTSRDESMARNVKWILDHAGKDARIVLWAHNGHVARQDYFGGRSMGAYLDQWYGKQQVIIGFAAAEGQYTAIAPNRGLRSDNALQPPSKGSFEESFRAIGLPMFALDLRLAAKDDSASAWLTGSHPFRSIGALAMDEQFGPADLRNLFDAIIYLDRTTPSRLLGGASGGRR